MQQKNNASAKPPRQRRLPEIFRYSEIRNGRFVRYFGKSTEIVIPDIVTAIAADAFRDNKKITRLANASA